ncbi:MAG: YbaB/EbfC family nucleoid-associated protein [Clostridia bacterium]|nr:YbaB/EbfC family nucleoid-associated protein [Clostridia bacterium]MBQ2272689.1 YbaB/EbfC family nucleoid-associated protein [Clostridia bacterium]MBQ5819930.1 YbaB/EbfC family nucleoid-associated protein [Clostridia bacterium]
MKVRIPQQNSQADMMRKLQQFQENSAKLEEELSEKEYDVTSGGGAVSVKIKGTKEVLEIKIDPDLLADAKDEPEMLEDLLVVAVNQAIELVESTHEEEMGKLTAGLNLPNIPGF